MPDSRRTRLPLAFALLFLLMACCISSAATTEKIPHLAQPPKLEDFEEMVPHGAAASMQKVTDFIQNYPSDGKPPTENTDAYFSYDDTNLYIVVVCWTKKPSEIRGSLSRREPSQPFDSDDYVEVTLDTFHDQRHGLVFDVNPRGVQADALWTEGQGTDYSWDTVWYSRSKITSHGYVVWMSIPFRSLRFHAMDARGWGATVSRYIARADETDFWPKVSAKVAGRLNQAATLVGMENISPSRNLQFIPYMEGRSFRAVDTRDPAQPYFSTAKFQGKVGLDAKAVFHDSLVLDATINPDFAQVESDDPQSTINQRFEVFFPEKRPFFLENSNFFEAPLIAASIQTRLVFTRRIADPTYGVRLTGKQGPWNLGFLVADDCGPGKSVPDNDPTHGKCATFGIGRVSHDIGKQSSIGVEYTDREFNGTYNRVGGFDATLRLNKNWNSTYRGYMSSTENSDGQKLFGQHHEAVLLGSGERFMFSLQYLDITPNFDAEAGFIPRTDQRSFNEYFHFYWHRDKKLIILHGVEENATQLWDHHGTTLQQVVSFDYVFGFKRSIIFAPIAFYESDVLRPIDFSAPCSSCLSLTSNRQFVQNGGGIVFRGSPTRMFSWNTRLFRNGTVVFVPAANQLPYTGDETALFQTISIKPVRSMQIDNTYILDRVVNGHDRHAVFNNHIIRSKVNYQFTKELSLRFIAQYNGLLTNPLYSSQQQTKNMNYDLLFTYLLHPGTAIYLGYNTNLENVDPGLCVHMPGSNECDPNGGGLLRTTNRLTNDGRQAFVKISYLFRR
jgi:hypothetical protein